MEGDKRNLCSVLVGDEQTEMFDLFSGVRQGCVMSPVLFSFFINGLAREIKEKTQGVLCRKHTCEIVVVC